MSKDSSKKSEINVEWILIARRNEDSMLNEYRWPKETRNQC